MHKTPNTSTPAPALDLQTIAQNICRLADLAKDEHLRSINRSQANALLSRFSPHARLIERRIAS